MGDRTVTPHTLESLLALPRRELDVLAAKAAGYEVQRKPVAEYARKPTDSGWMQVEYYSTDATAAMELADEMDAAAKNGLCDYGLELAVGKQTSDEGRTLLGMIDEKPSVAIPLTITLTYILWKQQQ